MTNAAYARGESACNPLPIFLDLLGHLEFFGWIRGGLRPLQLRGEIQRIHRARPGRALEHVLMQNVRCDSE